MGHTNCVAKTKALISFAVTVKLICVFVFAYAKCWFSHDAAHFGISILKIIIRSAKWRFMDYTILNMSILPSFHLFVFSSTSNEFAL